MKTSLLALGFLLLIAQPATQATEFHVATKGKDSNPGTASAPLLTIQRAADLAQSGDIITVHEGVYREQIDPPRGGESDTKRIVYRAAPGEKVEIKGSEVARGWTREQDGVWKLTLPNSFFGAFNPYKDLIRGDWFDPRGREHHTGAVYLDGEWLTEAVKLEEVLMPPGTSPTWLNAGNGQCLLNVAWLRPAEGTKEAERIPAVGFAAQSGILTAPCTEGGECIGWIEHGDWARYEKVDLGKGTETIELRVASATEGGVIEVRLDTPEGKLLGSAKVVNTGEWQAWTSVEAKIERMDGMKTLCLVFKAHPPSASNERTLNPNLWFAQVDAASTTIWAQFRGVEPNERLVEINVRRTVFYPSKPGRNFITLRGFTLRHAATPWAPPTAEQIGLVGTHWSRGWIIEDNVVSHSTCSGIALGKHGDEWDNTSANTAEGYVKTIERAHARDWNKETIGHHVVRKNTISHCEQAGIVGSMGAAFSTVTDNTIHDIHVRRLFSGAEMAGIKFHAAIDTVIARNHIYRTCLALWLDWMAQGTRVSQNLFHDNAGQDLFMEVDHGPFLVDNNIFLSPVSILDVSEGGAYAHNLLAGKIVSSPEPNRETPYHPAHSTKVAGLIQTKGGDDRFYNNILVGKGEAADGFGLCVYDPRELPLETGGNVYLHGARPYSKEIDPVIAPTHDPGIRLVEEGGRWRLHLKVGDSIEKARTTMVTTKLLGKAKIPDLPYESADGSPIAIDGDYFGAKRGTPNPLPGPFAKLETGPVVIEVR